MSEQDFFVGIDT